MTIRSVITGLALLFCTAFAAAQEPVAAPQPQITFAQTVRNFGTVYYKGEPQVREYRFTNTGDSPLVILRTELSCTCLSADFPKKPIQPGESGVIKVKYTPKKDLGEFRNTIRVITNTVQKRHTLFAEGEVVKK